MWAICGGCGFKAPEEEAIVLDLECAPEATGPVAAGPDGQSPSSSKEPCSPPGTTASDSTMYEQSGEASPTSKSDESWSYENNLKRAAEADAIVPDAIVPPAMDVAPPCVATPAETDALAKLQEALLPEELKAAIAALVPGESLESSLLRFLRAKDLKVPEAARALRVDLAWRKSVQPSKLADMKQEEVAECDRVLLEKYMPTWHQGFDRSGRPLMFAHYGKFRFTPVLAKTSVDKLLKLHVHNSEVAARLCGTQSAKLGREVSGVVTVVDAEGWDAGNLWVRNSFTWAQGMATIDQEHYPERLGTMMIINAPPVVYHFWKGLQYLLPEKTRESVQIFSGRDKWLPKLLELVDPEEIPVEYGGTGVHKGGCA